MQPSNNALLAHVEHLQKHYQEAVFVPWSKQKEARPLVVKEAEGVYLKLASGEVLLDMKSQAFSANLGHNHQGMLEALGKAVKNVRALGSDTVCPERLALALDLRRIAPGHEQQVLTKTFFTLGGAEANENAIKVARLVTKRHKIITRYRSYHGATLATINMSGDYRRIPLDHAMTGIIRFPDPYVRGSGQAIDTVRLLEEIIEVEGPETIAAIMLEGITGANGVFLPPPDYWPRIRALADRHGIMLIADEILSGFFRTGRWFGIDHFNTIPDIMTVSKGLTAGYMPLGAMMVSRKIAEHFDEESLWCGLTQYGPFLSCAAARAAIHFYERDHIGTNVQAREQELKAMLAALTEEHEIIGETRAIGLLAAIDLVKGRNDQSALVPYRATGAALKPMQLVQKALREEGISAIVRYGMIVLAPPLIISKDELKEGIDAISRALKKVEIGLR